MGGLPPPENDPARSKDRIRGSGRLRHGALAPSRGVPPPAPLLLPTTALGPGHVQDPTVVLRSGCPTHRGCPNQSMPSRTAGFARRGNVITIDRTPRSATGPGTVNDLCHKVTMSISQLRRMRDKLRTSKPREGGILVVATFGRRPNGELDDLVRRFTGPPSKLMAPPCSTRRVTRSHRPSVIKRRKRRSPVVAPYSEDRNYTKEGRHDHPSARLRSRACARCQDASGAGRMQVLDRSWTVVSQSPSAGSPTRGG